MGTMRKVASPQWQNLRAGMADMQVVTAKVGWFESAKYEDGTPVAYVASIQEFGSGPIPPRPFMRTTIAEQAPAWTALMGAAAKGIASGKRTAAACMELVGGQAAGDTRAKIASITAPKLSDATLAARARRGNGSTKPLVDTRIMLPTLTHVVGKGDAK